MGVVVLLLCVEMTVDFSILVVSISSDFDCSRIVKLSNV